MLASSDRDSAVLFDVGEAHGDHVVAGCGVVGCPHVCSSPLWRYGGVLQDIGDPFKALQAERSATVHRSGRTAIRGAGHEDEDMSQPPRFVQLDWYRFDPWSISPATRRNSLLHPAHARLRDLGIEPPVGENALLDTFLRAGFRTAARPRRWKASLGRSPQLRSDDAPCAYAGMQ
ncbi:MAG TPA: hypothetical protein VGU65_07460 [Frateuria sp.]|uniref:hypothetical protein n=1 Tax=Frateuria sp. TaxID=2211372 RepID=UPI002DE64426|nr:hypothetical protein [Frateuria sp.]